MFSPPPQLANNNFEFDFDLESGERRYYYVAGDIMMGAISFSYTYVVLTY